MSSSPSRPQTRATTPKRTPLAERTQSQANEISSRLLRDTRQDPDRFVYGTSPFPTKPAHVLLPSTLRKQKSSQNLVPDIFSTTSAPLSPNELSDQPRAGRRPPVKLKRSVKTLRDLYEAQAEEPRPSTALSASQRSSRPGTSNSRLRSASSSDGLSGRYAWEHFKSIQADDLALLPSLPETAPTLKQIGSKSSFASRAGRQAATSSPNFRIHDITSSPRIPVYRDLSEISSEGASEELPTEPSTVGESSPNIVKLGRTSSVEELDPLDEPSSSPNFIKLGTSSPARTVKGAAAPSPVQRPTSSSSTSSRKRKRSGTDEGRSFAARAGAANPFPSSPPYDKSSDSAEGPSSPTPAGIRSSPPKSESQPPSSIDDSSPVVRILSQGSSGSDQPPFIESHANLQAALTSSPAPPIQYPVVRAPPSAQVAGLFIPKRKYRSSQTSESLSPRWPSRLSAAQCEEYATCSRSDSKTISKRSSFVDDDLEIESPPPVAYSINESANNSQIRIIPDSERHEGEDEVTALPGDGYDYRSPASSPIRNNSYLSNSGSSQSRLNSLQHSLDNRIRSMSSLAHSRHDSLRSYRPDSSGSMMSTIAVPTWARRYYSGFYPDSFKYLAQSNSNVNLAAPQPRPAPPPAPAPQPAESLATSRRSSRQSLQSIRRSISDRIASIMKRPRLEARRSHAIPGIGPLVSNPVRGPATAAVTLQNHAQPFDPRATIRPVSLPFSPADPRSQWNGVIEDFAASSHYRHSYPPQPYTRPTSVSTTSNDPSQPSIIHRGLQRNRLSRIVCMSPHLHHDHRLNTGSTASRGFGYPFNRKSNRWSAPSIYDGPQSWSGTLRNTQAVCFLAGFALFPTWFIGALLPLPQRPDSFEDIEKAHWSGRTGEMTDWEEMDVISRLRAEKRLKGQEEVNWQNARWWRTLNRWMCVVGVLVAILLIVLTVLGTRKNW